jgi:predicted enzyme related to lactoylglutathione lyase
MLRGFCTITYWADDMQAATRWYTELLGVEPYFKGPVEGPPAYVEWRIGDYQAELGLLDRRYAPEGAAATPGGVVMNWHVDDIRAAFDRLLSMGAKEYQPITPMPPGAAPSESGFVIASVIDPFGNILGIMYNPHYLEILGSEPASRERA